MATTGMARDGEAPIGEAASGVVARLSAFRGVALVVDADAAVLAASAGAEPIARACVDGAAPKVAELVATARHDGAFAQAEVAIGDAVFDLVVVPLADDGALLVTGRELTMDRNLRSALIESRQRYKDLVECSSDFAWEVDAAGAFAFVSPRGALGYPAAELVGRRPDDVLFDSAADEASPFVADRPFDEVELWMRRRDGTSACVVASSLPLFDDAGSWRGARGVCRDVTADREREAALARARHREELLNFIVGALRDEVEPSGMLSAAASATSLALGASGARIYRRADDEAFEAAATFGEEAAPDTPDTWRGRIQATDTVAFEDGGLGFLAAATRYRGDVNGAVLLWKAAGDQAWTEDEELLLADVAGQLGIAIEQISNHERILRLSRTDGLTGLLNRRAFIDEEIPRRIARLERHGEGAALLYIDLDNLKRVNDLHGHQRGDDAILALRDLLLDHSRPRDALARLGGDEFAVWLDRIPFEVVEKRVRQLQDKSAVLLPLSGDADHPLGMSIGVAFFDPAIGESPDELLARADAAMYAVKRAGKGGYRVAAMPG